MTVTVRAPYQIGLMSYHYPGLSSVAPRQPVLCQTNNVAPSHTSFAQPPFSGQKLLNPHTKRRDTAVLTVTFGVKICAVKRQSLPSVEDMQFQNNSPFELHMRCIMSVMEILCCRFLVATSATFYFLKYP